MERFPSKKRFPGLRFGAFVVTSLAGATAAFAVPIAVLATVLSGLRAVFDPVPEPIVMMLAFLGLGIFGVSLHLLGRVVTWALKLRAPWGDLVVGRDGIAWEGLLRRRFLPWSAVRSVKVTGEELRLHTTDGASPRVGVDDPKAVHQAIRRAQRAAEGEVGIPEVLKRADAEPWLEAVRALGVGGYRQAVTDETLAEVLEHPSTPPLPRWGAAIALGKREPAKVRVVIDDIADEETKEALTAALEGEPSVAMVQRLAKRS